jgi:hypothetical protein
LCIAFEAFCDLNEDEKMNAGTIMKHAVTDMLQLYHEFWEWKWVRESEATPEQSQPNNTIKTKTFNLFFGCKMFLFFIVQNKGHAVCKHLRCVR